MTIPVRGLSQPHPVSIPWGRKPVVPGENQQISTERLLTSQISVLTLSEK